MAVTAGAAADGLVRPAREAATAGATTRAAEAAATSTGGEIKQGMDRLIDGSIDRSNEEARK